MKTTSPTPFVTEHGGFSRRDLLGVGLRVAASSAITSLQAVQAAPLILDVSDPERELTSYVKMRGSLADDTIYYVYDLDIFAVRDGTIEVPLVGARGITKHRWRALDGGGFTNTDWDIGVYVDFRNRTLLKDWKNPLNGRTVPALHYISGPSGGRFRVNARSGDPYSDLTRGRWSQLGDRVVHTSVATFEGPNPVKVREYPTAGSAVFRASMSTTYISPLAAIHDPNVKSAPCQLVWTDNLTYPPWMEMGAEPGSSSWRMIATKVALRADLPPGLIDEVEAVFPGYIRDDTIWSEPSTGFSQYIKAHPVSAP